MLPGLVLLTLLATTVAEPCPKSWHRVDGQCYWVSDYTVQWDAVAGACRDLAPHSAPLSIHSQEEANTVAGLVDENQQTWLGLSRTNAAGSFSWKDGTALDFTDWAAGEPSMYGDCGVFDDVNGIDQWYTEKCDSQQYFICKQASSCPAGWSQFEDKCYIFVDEGIYGYELPQKCADQRLGAEPVSIHSPQLNSLLYSMCGYTGRAWIGLRRTNRDDTYKWYDDSDLNYENWYDEPGSDNYFFVYMCGDDEYGHEEDQWLFAFSPTFTRNYFCQIKL